MTEARRACPACGSQNFLPLYALSGGIFNRCLSCSLVFLEGELSEKELKAIYDREDYQQFSYYVSGLEKRIALDRLDWLSDKVSLVPGARVLDFGCGDGFFLYVFRQAYPELEFFGLDLSEAAVEKGRSSYGLNLVAGEIDERTFPESFFDLVTMYHVVEHLTEPLKVIKQLFRVTRPGGKIVITTPNEDYLLLKSLQLLYKISGGKVKIFLDKFYNFEHINSFSEKSLKFLLERGGFKAAGFWQDERYFTKFCLSCFNFFERSLLEAVTILSRVLEREAEITVIGERQ